MKFILFTVILLIFVGCNKDSSSSNNISKDSKVVAGAEAVKAEEDCDDEDKFDFKKKEEEVIDLANNGDEGCSLKE